jgi:hypothetical protein
VVDAFGWLDPVEEFLVADRVGEMRERFGDGQGPGWVAAGAAEGPLLAAGLAAGMLWGLVRSGAGRAQWQDRLRRAEFIICD